jgi:Domain of unknown function (DUF1987).
MKTDRILSESNFKHPRIVITEDGHLSISGNSISVRPEDSFVPLIKWLTAYKGEILNIDINLNIVSCRSLKLLLQAIMAADLNTEIKNKSITWFFDDREEEEIGEMISSNVKDSKFNLFSKN